METFNHWTTWQIMGNEIDVLISGSFTVSKGCPATRMEPEEYPDIEIYDLTVELGTGRNITPPKSFNSRFIEAHIDWETLLDEVMADYNDNETAAYYDAADRKLDEMRDESWI